MTPSLNSLLPSFGRRNFDIIITMSEEETIPQPDLVEIPLDVREIIGEEVQKDIVPILEEDPETAEFLRETMTKDREQVFSFLSWIKRKFNPLSVLYPASGFDVMPKLVFGEETVVHTSLEEYKADSKIFLGDLGEGKKVVAKIEDLPFPNSEFQAMVIMGVECEFIAPRKDELFRVLDEGGVMVLARNILTDFDEEETRSWKHFLEDLPLEQVSVPDQFQGGELDTEFLVFRKTSG